MAIGLLRLELSISKIYIKCVIITWTCFVLYLHNERLRSCILWNSWWCCGIKFFKMQGTSSRRYQTCILELTSQQRISETNNKSVNKSDIILKPQTMKVKRKNEGKTQSTRTMVQALAMLLTDESFRCLPVRNRWTSEIFWMCWWRKVSVLATEVQIYCH